MILGMGLRDPICEVCTLVPLLWLISLYFKPSDMDPSQQVGIKPLLFVSVMGKASRLVFLCRVYHLLHRYTRIQGETTWGSLDRRPTEAVFFFFF